MNLTSKAPSKPWSGVLSNPTDAQRHEMVRESLIKAERPEDYEYIIRNFSPPPDITTYASPGQYKGVKVAVVGAGIAGLAAAFELRKLGFDITIFEADEQRIGGRIYTHYFDKDRKLYGELGAGRIPVSHEAVWHYINLFGLNTTRLTGGKGDTFIYVRGVKARNNSEDIMKKIYPQFNLTPAERNTPWPELYDQVLESALKSLSPESRAQMLEVIPFEEYNPDYLRIIIKSVREALVEAGLSEEAIALITSLSPTVNAFITGSFYTELITEYGLSTQNTYRIDGGMANLPLAFYKSLTSYNPREYNVHESALGKVTFKMGSWVTRAYKSHIDGNITLRYITKDVPKTFEAFDYVFFTIPLTALRKMLFIPSFSNPMMESIREVSYVDAQKTLFLCNERFWEKQGITRGVTNTDLIIQLIMYPQDRQYCMDKPDTAPGCGPNVPGVLTASYNIGSDAVRLGNTRDYRFMLIKRQVELVHGLPEGYLDNVVMDLVTVDWNSNQWITGAFVNFPPGQGIRYLFQMLMPEYDNRLYFAGEAYHPPNGWIQAALKSAMISTNGLAYYLKTYGHK